jgi:uncharacterized protein YigE (DUF2233 family)
VEVGVWALSLQADASRATAFSNHGFPGFTPLLRLKAAHHHPRHGMKKSMVENRKGGCLKMLLLALLAGGLLLWLIGEVFYNVGSNSVALSVRDSKGVLQVRSRKGAWRKVSTLTPTDLQQALIVRHSEPGLTWSTLKVNRPSGLVANLAQGLLGAEVHVIVIAPEQFEFMTSFKPKFAVTTAAERLSTDKLAFAITGNFRDPAGKPLGYVWHEGKQLNPEFKDWSGCFFVKGGRPYFGPKSLLKDVPGLIEEATQGYPSVMKNQTVFPYIDVNPDSQFDGSKITYRSLAGMKRDGTIVFVLSGDGGVMNISEVTALALKLEVDHATLLDGGRALQYSLMTEDGPWHFAALNTRLNFKHRWLEPQRSPVYIGVRRRAPQIISVGQSP